MLKSQHIIFIILLNLSASFSWGSCDDPFQIENYSEPVTIPQLIDMALSSSPETRSAWWNATRAAAACKLEASSYYPVISANLAASHGRDYKFPNGKETVYTRLDGDLLLSYLLYDFGERKAANQAAKAALWMAQWQSDGSIQKVMLRVISSVYSYFNALEILEAYEASLKDALEALKAAEELKKAGLRSVTDLYAAKATVAELEMQIAQKKADVDVARGKVMLTIGLPYDQVLDIALLPEPVPDLRLEKGIDCLIDLAKNERADLMMKWAELVKNQAEREKIEKKYWPKLRLDADSGYKRYLHDRTNGFCYNVGINLEIPLFNGFASVYQNRMAYADQATTEAELEKLELEITLEILTYSRHFEAAQKILKYAQDNFKNSSEVFKGVFDKYKTGMQSIFDLTLAERQLAESRIKRSEAKINWYRTLAQLAYATGTIAQYTEGPCDRSP